MKPSPSAADVIALLHSTATQAPSPPLPANPDGAAAAALAFVIDPASREIPVEVYQELARRNRELTNAPRQEIQAALARQITLLEATATRLMQKAVSTSNQAAAAEFMRIALATERVLIQALGAVHQMNQNQARPPEQLRDVNES